MSPENNRPAAAFGVISLVLGIMSIILGMTGLGIVFGIPAIILGIIAIHKRVVRGIGIAGVVTGGVGILMSLVALLFFVALGSLQGSQRDVERKQDVSSVSAAISEYRSSHQGQLPAADEITAQSFASTWFSSVNRSVTTDQDAADKNNYILYTEGETCPENGAKKSQTAFNLQVKLENGTVYCQDI